MRRILKKREWWRRRRRCRGEINLTSFMNGSCVIDETGTRAFGIVELMPGSTF